MAQTTECVISKKKEVTIHVTFIKLGEINTLKECFEAKVLLRSRWREPALDGSQVTSNTDLSTLWTPHLFVENVIGEPKVKVNLRVEMENSGRAYVVERRWVSGKFMEQLELLHFPFDVQDLSICLMSEKDSEVTMVEDPTEVHRVYKQSFIDEQEWYLYRYIESVRSDTDLDIEDSGDFYSKKATLTVRCRAARRSAYFLWNIFSVTFLLCCLAFATFAVNPEKIENRLQLSFTLVLTSVTFKFIVNQSLPKISYLTYLDRYVLGNMILLALVCTWHALLLKVPENSKDNIDTLSLICFCGIYLVYNLVFWVNIYLKPFRKRRKMRQKELEYTNEVIQESEIRASRRLHTTNTEAVEIETLLSDTVKPTESLSQ